MTQQLLLKDLCARLPYKLVCEVKFREDGKHKTSNMFLDGVFKDEAYFTSKEGSIYSNNYKPYLFPLSSMTEEQKQYIKDRYCYGWDGDPDVLWGFQTEIGEADGLIDWFHENHFDYRGLIPKRLAKDATGLNIY